MSDEDFYIIGGVVLFVIVLIAAVFKLVQHTKKKVLENFQKLQQKYPSLRLSVDEQGSYGTKGGNLLEGKIRDIPFICYGLITGSGDNTVHWTYCSFEHNFNLNNYNLHLRSEGLMSKFGKSLSVVQEIEIGVPDFDSRFLIQTENEMITKALLNSAIREKMMQIPKLYFGDIIIQENTLIYKIPYQLANDRFYGYFEQGLELSLNLLTELKRHSK